MTAEVFSITADRPEQETLPLMAVARESDVKNVGMREQNLLSLSYGKIVRKDINSADGLLPASFETYQIVAPGVTVLRFTDLQNDKRSLRSGLVTERGIITSAYVAVDPFAMDPRFFAYVMRAYDTNKVFYGMGGGVRQGLSFDSIRRLPVPRLPVDEQRAIADYLDRETAQIDALVAKQKEFVGLLRERRATVITSEFGSTNKSRLRHAIKLSQTGPFGTQLSANEYVAEGIPVINPSHINRGFIEPDRTISVSSSKSAELSRHRLELGDIVLGRKGEVDKSALVTDAEVGFICGSDSMLLRPAAGTVPSYLWWFFQSSEAHKQLERWSVGSTVAGLNQTTISKVAIPLPSVTEQHAIIEHIHEQTSRIDTLIDKSEEHIALAKERRAALITAAVTGQIDVRTAAQRVN